jgi:hypothetical protein
MTETIRKLVTELENDEEYRFSWKANIAMAFVDAYSHEQFLPGEPVDIHKVANAAADYFLNNLCRNSGE